MIFTYGVGINHAILQIMHSIDPLTIAFNLKRIVCLAVRFHRYVCNFDTMIFIFGLKFSLHIMQYIYPLKLHFSNGSFIVIHI